MKNIQIVDGAANATLSIFQATDEEFDAMFPDGQDMELVEDLIDRLGPSETRRVLSPVWDRPILKREAQGIHGTLYYDNDDRRAHIPPTKREVDWADATINYAQRQLFARHRG